MKVRGIILDWAGTTVDYGSRAPTAVFVEIFRRRNVKITDAEARGPMGRSKRDHIAELAALPHVAKLWQRLYGRPATKADVESMYQEFLPLQKETLAKGSEVIPGVPQAIELLRSKGIKIGSTTGYTRELMEVVFPQAVSGGYVPDVVVCSDEVTAGRPAPWMNFRAAELLGIYPMKSVIVVDDTGVGIEAGLNAGAITIGVTKTGNGLGLSQAEVEQLAPELLASRLQQIGQEFLNLGAHYVIESVADLPQLLQRIAEI